MSVVVITKIPAKATALEALADKHGDTLVSISEDGKNKGALHHMFVEDADGNVMVIDEWDSEASFHAFFDAQDDVKRVVGEAGLAGAPTSAAYRILDLPDRF